MISDQDQKHYFLLLKTEIINIHNSLISRTIQLNLTKPVFYLQKITIHDYWGNSYYFLWKNDKGFLDFVYTIFYPSKEMVRLHICSVGLMCNWQESQQVQFLNESFRGRLIMSSTYLQYMCVQTFCKVSKICIENLKNLIT